MRVGVDRNKYQVRASPPRAPPACVHLPPRACILPPCVRLPACVHLPHKVTMRWPWPPCAIGRTVPPFCPRQIQIPLPPKIDPTVTMMTVEEKPDITYNDIGGNKDEIQKLREV
jgi:hypothetical protein